MWVVELWRLMLYDFWHWLGSLFLLMAIFSPLAGLFSKVITIVKNENEKFDKEKREGNKNANEG